jgi:hypothetical protein
MGFKRLTPFFQMKSDVTLACGLALCHDERTAWKGADLSPWLFHSTCIVIHIKNASTECMLPLSNHFVFLGARLLKMFLSLDMD